MGSIPFDMGVSLCVVAQFIALVPLATDLEGHENDLYAIDGQG